MKDFAKVPNLILEAVARGDFTITERKVLNGIFRETFGWNRWERKVVRVFLAKMTKISESHVSDAITSLTKKGVIYVKGNRIGVQRESTVWEKFLPEGSIYKVPSAGKSSSVQKEVEFPVWGSKSSVQRESTKETKETYKETPKEKKIYDKFTEEEIAENKRKANAAVEELKRKYE